LGRYDGTYTYADLVLEQPVLFDGIALEYNATNTFSDQDTNRAGDIIPFTLEDGVPSSRYSIVSTNEKPIPFDALFKDIDGSYRMPFVSIKDAVYIDISQVSENVLVNTTFSFQGITSTFVSDTVTYINQLLSPRVELGRYDGTYTYADLVLEQPVLFDGIALEYNATNTFSDQDTNRAGDIIPFTLEDGVPSSRYSIVSTNEKPIPFDVLFKDIDGSYRMPFVSIKGDVLINMEHVIENVIVKIVFNFNIRTSTYELSTIGTYSMPSQIMLEGNVDGNVEF
jgi:hypothetical protein